MFPVLFAAQSLLSAVEETEPYFTAAAHIPTASLPHVTHPPTKSVLNVEACFLKSVVKTSMFATARAALTNPNVRTHLTTDLQYICCLKGLIYENYS